MRRLFWSLTYGGERLAATFRQELIRKAVLVLWWLGIVIMLGFLFRGIEG